MTIAANSAPLNAELPDSAAPSEVVAPGRDASETPSPIAQTSKSFHIKLSNFDGPFDLLLQLISQHRMDVTEVALHTVTDEFIGHLKTLGNDWDLGHVTEFLVVAATLLDLKAARLLPDADVEDEGDLALLEARDLLFARLMAYKAYQQVSALFRELEATALRRYPRAVTLEARYLGLLPEVNIGMDAQAFAELASGVFKPKPPPPTVSLDHIHASPVSVAEHTLALREMLSTRGAATFSELIVGCTQTLEVVARFLGLLNLYREAAVLFDQPEPLGELMVRWSGDEKGDAGVTTDEEYE